MDTSQVESSSSFTRAEEHKWAAWLRRHRGTKGSMSVMMWAITTWSTPESIIYAIQSPPFEENKKNPERRAWIMQSKCQHLCESRDMKMTTREHKNTIDRRQHYSHTSSKRAGCILSIPDALANRSSRALHVMFTLTLNYLFFSTRVLKWRTCARPNTVGLSWSSILSPPDQGQTHPRISMWSHPSNHGAFTKPI